MSKYIDADRLDGWGIRLSRTTERGDEVITTNAMELANVLTAFDVIEVVRCRDCKYSRSDEFEPLWCYLSETCDPVKADHFCGYGERRDE